MKELGCVESMKLIPTVDHDCVKISLQDSVQTLTCEVDIGNDNDLLSIVVN
jgi:hypothetical protein